MESKEKHLKRYYDRREWSIKYLGGICKECGTNKDLQFDHIDINTKTYSVSKIMMYKIDTLKNELDKCQLLCNKCHKKKSILDGSTYKNTPIGSRVYSSKLAEKDIVKIKQQLANNDKMKHIAKDYNVSYETIKNIRSGRSWKHVL